MSKKLEQNGLWEASRMMLPQHREAFVAKQKTLAQPVKPIIHEDEYELIVRQIKESYYTQKLITVEHFRENQKEYVTGSVSNIDETNQRIKLQQADDFTWLSFDEITNVSRYQECGTPLRCEHTQYPEHSRER